MAHTNDVNYARYIDSARHSDSDFDQQQASDDSDVSEGPRRKSGPKAARSRGQKLRTLNRWTAEEHDRLAFLVSKWGSEKNWAKVAEDMPGRTGKQCRERWLNHMKPGIIKGNWSCEEEFLLAQCHAVVGSHWSKMTKRLPGRTENSIKNFWNATLRSKAPHKRRGILWLYMQQQTSQEGENIDAFLLAVQQLYESHDLPPYWALLMDQGRLPERTLRAVLRAEKDFLENPDAELHPLALPHPTHGLMPPADAAAGAAAGAAAAEADAPQQHDTARRSGRQARVQPQPLADADAAAAAAAAANGYGPISPLPAGLTPRIPGGDLGLGPHSSAPLPCPAAFEVPTVLGGLSLPPELLAALGQPAAEMWPSLTSAQAPAGPFTGALGGGLEALMPALGMTSDMHPSGTTPGAFAANGGFGGNGGSMLAACQQDSFWACLPSIRGLNNMQGLGVGQGPAAAFEPQGGLQGLHNHSSNSTQTQRPDSALEYEPPHGQHTAGAAGAESHGFSGHSSSRPPSSLDHASAEAQQQQYDCAMQAAAAAAGYGGFAGSASASPSMDNMVDHHQQPPAAMAAAVVPPGSAQEAWLAHNTSDGNADQHMQAAAAAGGYGGDVWGAQFQQQQPQQYQQQQQYQPQQYQQQQVDTRGGSPTESGAHNEPAPDTHHTAGHAPNCSCLVCVVRSQHKVPASGSPHSSNSMVSPQVAGSYGGGVNWGPQGGNSAAAAYNAQQQQCGGSAVGAPACQAYDSNLPPTSGPYAAMWPPAAVDAAAQQGNGLQHQQQRQLSGGAAVNGLQHQHSSTDSPFAPHAQSGWEGGSAAAAAVAAPVTGAAAQEHRAGGAAAAAGDAANDTDDTGAMWRPLHQPVKAKQQQQQLPPPPRLQLGTLTGAPAPASLFSPCMQSPATGTLQQLLDQAAARAGIRAQDICAWLAAASAGGSGSAQGADGVAAPAAQQQQVPQAWLESDELTARPPPPPTRALGFSYMDLTSKEEGGTGAGSGVHASHDKGPAVAAAAVQETNYAPSILEVLLGGRRSSAQLGDALLSPAGHFSTAAFLQGFPPPTPAGAAAAALQMAIGGLKRERSCQEGGDEGDLLIDEPGMKAPRVF